MRQTLIVKVTKQHTDERCIMCGGHSLTYLGKDITCVKMTRSAEVRGKKVHYCMSEVVTHEMLMKENALQE